jgi:hypothetical protein
MEFILVYIGTAFVGRIKICDITVFFFYPYFNLYLKPLTVSARPFDYRPPESRVA